MALRVVPKVCLVNSLHHLAILDGGEVGKVLGVGIKHVNKPQGDRKKDGQDLGGLGGGQTPGYFDPATI